jgi:small-conductance mechanosensitive channel
MKISTLFIKILVPFIFIICILCPILVVGQQSAKASVDTLIPEIEVVKMSEIAIKSGEVWTQTSRLYESLLSAEDIDEMNVNNDSIVGNVKELLNPEKDIDLATKSIRYLNNKKIYWETFIDVLDIEKTMISTNIKMLNEQKHDFEAEILIWENTKTAIKDEEAEPTTVNRVVELISQLRGVVENVQKKNDVLLAMLDGTTVEVVILTEHVDRIDKELEFKKGDVFVRDQPLIYLIEYSDSTNWRFKEPVLFFYNTEVVELGKYVDDYFLYFVFQIFFIIVLIIGFRMVKKHLLKTDISKNTIYQQMLRQIFSRNISAALILGIFASVWIFPNRPELFKDINILIVSFPLLIIASTLIEKKFFKYLYLFALIIYLRFIYTLFPADNLYSTFTMILVALIESFVLWKLALYFYKNSLSNKVINNLFVILLIINLGFSISGLLAVLIGATILSEMALQVPVSIFIGGILVFITAIILNGLIDVGTDSKAFRKLNFVKLYGDDLRNKAIAVVNFVAITYWFSLMLSTVNARSLVLDGIINFFTFEIPLGSTFFTIWDVVVFFLVIWLSIIISRMIRILLEEDILNKVKLGKGVPHTIAMMVRYSIITLGVIIAVTAAGIPVDNLTVLIGAFGVGIGFGLQNIFNNLVSGFILLFERPIQIGDTIEIGQVQLTGVVKSIGVRASNVRTFDGAEVIVPNGLLVSNEVVNWTLSDRRRRIEIITGVAYGSDTYKVKELLLKVLADHPRVLGNPKPSVLFVALGDSSLDFRMLFWTADSSNWIDVRSDVMFGIYDVLNEEGVTIPFPQMDVHLSSAHNKKGDIKG